MSPLLLLIGLSKTLMKHFSQDLATDLGSFSDILVDSDINEACFTWIKTIQHQLDHHAPVKSRRVKHKRLSERQLVN